MEVKEFLDFGTDFEVELPEEQDDKFRVIPQSEYVPEWEEEVKRYMLISPNLPFNGIKYEHVEIPTELDAKGFERWATEEIRRCREGYNGMPGKMYFYFNYCWIQKLGKKIRPEFRVIDNEWFKFIEACQKSNEWGIICVKRRRVGASWKEAADALHDCLFNSNFNVGMNSKTERDSGFLLQKVKFLYDSLPEFIRVPNSSNTQSYLKFTWFIDSEGKVYSKGGGNRKEVGNFSSIIVVPPTDTAYEGLMLSKWVCDEAGKCLAPGTRVLMYDGTFKPVEKIIKGDILMGPDSKPRTVLGTTKGMDQMFQIIPTRGTIWSCNAPHVLSLKARNKMNILGKRVNTDDIINISVSEFYKLPKWKQKNLLQYRKSIEYTKKEVFDPYLIGLWLGDGDSDHPRITSMDKEVIEYLQNKYKITKQSLNSKADRYYILGVRNIFTKLGFLNGFTKRIPKCYLNNDIKTRLELLAGVIDSDGHLKAKSKTIEITQKSEQLSEDIVRLALSCGLWAYKKKIKNYFIIYISGNNLNNCPIKIPRKKIKKSNKRSGETTCIMVRPVGLGDYYGFELKEDPLFVLYDDFTVTHNTKNLATMFQYTEDCLMQETRRVGMPVIFGTAGDIGAEGKDLEYMWRNAHQYKLKKFFFSGWMGLNCDEFGNDDKENCIRWVVYGRKQREGLRIEELNTFIQKYPLTIPEAFTVTTSAGVGNIVKVKAQMQSLSDDPPVTQRGWFRMKGVDEVEFVVDAKGKCIIYEKPQKSIDDLYIAGVDPSDHNDTFDEVSDLAMYVMQRPHGTSPAKIVFEYVDRPADVTEYYEQALMAAIYYNNAKLMIERNRYGMINFFEKSSFKHLLARTPVGVIRVRSGRTNTYGIMMTPANKEYGKQLIAKYIEDHYEFIPSRELLEEFIYFGARNTDRAMSFMMCLMYLEDYKTPAMEMKKNIVRAPHFGYKNINGKIQRVTYTLEDAKNKFPGYKAPRL